MVKSPNNANQHGPQTPLRGICGQLFAALSAKGYQLCTRV